VALLGATSARSAGRLEDAVGLFAAALAIEPAHERALGEQGEVLFELRDLAAARRHLEAWLALPGRDDALRARRLALLGRTLDGQNDPVAALARYTEAIALDSGRQDAREGLVSLHERAGRRVEAIAGLEAWAAVATPAVRASCFTRAAELGLGETGLPAAAEAHLRAALAADRRAEQAWVVLATRLATVDRTDDALATASEGLEHVREGLGRAALLAVRGRALEARGSRRDAAAAYREAAQCDPADLADALAAARLLRALGEWRQAADTLASFAAHYAAADRSGLGEVLLQLGRLRAGPLEDVDGAIEAYEQALAVQPQLREAREALAELLTFRPGRWEEARARHRELLDAQPTRVASLRGLLRIAEAGVARARAPLENGLAILRALGAASPTEREAAPAALTLTLGRDGSLGNVVWERARHLVREAAQEIGQALGSPAAALAAVPAAGDPAASFRQAALEAEGALTAPALVALPAEEAGAVIALVARLAHEREQLSGDGRLVNAISDALGRWARRRVRKAMGSSSPEEIAEIDFVAWRSELRALAHAAALDTCGGNLRAALCALLQDAGQLASLPGEEVDLTSLVEGTPDARELLRRVVVAWAETV
jgi:tetratricopeptide (TPR) repeat protein